ncbi:Guanine nucleotide exchange factor lte1 [Physocladia obscura]|uniref:Guanine nucleotide exchange factor lte1 n=1 Tax=Physocladia obscura TaxID=109957 RepID=A0AAD5XJ58_9FUNG|nr:Guanine nucleotide exchange factor lte1 [Physocladia obscura]
MDISDLTYTIPAFRHSKTNKTVDTRYVPLTVRNLLATSKVSATIIRNQKTALQLPAENSLSLQEAINNAPQKFKRLPKVLYFPVLRAIENDRGAHHSSKEVENDPFLKNLLPGEAGFMENHAKVIELLLNTSTNHSARLITYERRFAEVNATRYDIRVQADELYEKTRQFIESNCLDYLSGFPRELWTQNRQLNRLETMEEKMNYLHSVYMWIVQGCFDRERIPQSKNAIEAKRKKAHSKQNKDSEGHMSQTVTIFGLEKEVKSERNRLIESLKPPKPIPPEDIKSIGNQIRRRETAHLRKYHAPKNLRLLLRNERRGEGVTLEEIRRVQKALKYAHTQAKIGKDPLDFRDDFVVPNSKSYVDWTNELEFKKFELEADSKNSEEKFSVRTFISNYLRLQNVSISNTVQTSSKKIRPENSLATVQKSSLPRLFEEEEEEGDNDRGLSKIFKKIENSTINRHKNQIISSIGSNTLGQLAKARKISELKPQQKQNSLIRNISVNGGANSANGGIYQGRNTKIASWFRKASNMKPAAEILMYKIPHSSLWNIFHDEIVEMLKKVPWDRSSDEIQILFNMLRSIAAFEHMRDFVVRDVCANSIAFHDSAEAWHIILTGSVNVIKIRNGVHKEYVHLRTMHAGEGFGDAGLLNDTVRAASIITADLCEIIEIKKDDYNRVIKASHRRSMEEVANFLKSLDLFSKWKKESLIAIASVMWFKVIKEGETVIDEGDSCKVIYFVKSGAVTLHKTILYNNKPTAVKVAIVGYKSMICTEAILYQEQEAKAAYYRSHHSGSGGGGGGAGGRNNNINSSIMRKTSENGGGSRAVSTLNSITSSASIGASKFTIKASTLREYALLRAACSLDAADPHSGEEARKKQEEIGLVMDLRKEYDFSKLEPQDWVYDDFGELVATSAIKICNNNSNGNGSSENGGLLKQNGAFWNQPRIIGSILSTDIERSDSLVNNSKMGSGSSDGGGGREFDPKHRRSIQVIKEVVRVRPKIGGAVLACSVAATARVELKDLDSHMKLLDITDEECVKIHEMWLERKKWIKYKKVSLDKIAKETKDNAGNIIATVFAANVAVAAVDGCGDDDDNSDTDIDDSGEGISRVEARPAVGVGGEAFEFNARDKRIGREADASGRVMEVPKTDSCFDVIGTDRIGQNDKNNVKKNEQKKRKRAKMTNQDTSK